MTQIRQFRRLRRRTLCLLSASALSAMTGGSGRTFAATAPVRPLLATPEQIDAEKTLLRLLQDPELKRLQASLRAELAMTPRGRTADGAARLDNAIAQWTNSFIFAELARYRARPAILWGTDDTPRTWLGHTVGGVGTSGDNPDAIYRSASLDGAGTYEILGRFAPDKRAVQLVIDAYLGDLTEPAAMFGQDSKHSDLSNQLALLTDRDLTVTSDGRFRITLGGPAEAQNHIATRPGQITVGFRDMLADWTQRPCQLEIRRLDRAVGESITAAELLPRVYSNLSSYAHFWAAFPDVWLGGLKANTVSDPAGRTGGWGYVAGLRYQLAPGQAIVVTTGTGDARYTGFQLVDPWMIAPNARRYQASLNLSQATPNPDGGFTYVISPSDPGVPNWLDTAGLHEGFGIIRWQGLPNGASKDALLREFRVGALSELAGMPELPRITPAQRHSRLAVRSESYASRVR